MARKIQDRYNLQPVIEIFVLYFPIDLVLQQGLDPDPAFWKSQRLGVQHLKCERALYGRERTLFHPQAYGERCHE